MAPTKPCETQSDLSLAYTPGVAEPVRAIQRDPDAAYRYTNKGNLVAVISNGTAVLGLGNTGALPFGVSSHRLYSRISFNKRDRRGVP